MIRVLLCNAARLIVGVRPSLLRFPQRAFGVDAFAFVGRWPQRLAASIAGSSSLAPTPEAGANSWQLLGPGSASWR